MFSVLQFFSRLQDLFQFFKASLQHGAQGSWTSSAVEFHDLMTSRTPVRSNPRNISSRCFYLSTSCFCGDMNIQVLSEIILEKIHLPLSTASYHWFQGQEVAPHFIDATS